MTCQLVNIFYRLGRFSNHALPPQNEPANALRTMPFFLLRLKKYIFWHLIALFAVAKPLHSQQLPHPDSVEMLLTNIAIQIECTQAINNMYNFKFGQAESIFQWLRRTYPHHPLPYFLMGLSQWWKIMPNPDNTRYDERFLAYMDSAIDRAEKIFDKGKPKQKIEAAFFLAAAWGFKGRLYSDRRQWAKATLAGKRAIHYMEYASDKNDLSPELLFGDGLYNYYSIWVPENYPMLKPVLWFFKKGDKALGIKQLEQVVADAFYAKTEAMNFLMRIYSDENMPEKAFETAKYLHKTFPDNPYFHRYYARLLYQYGQFYELESVAKSILEKIDSGMPGYEEVSGRYASFYLAHLYRVGYRDAEKAKYYYQRTVEFSEKIQAYDAGYYLFALSELAQMAHGEKNILLAKQYYEKIVQHADKDHPTYKEAKEYLKKHRKVK
ncbi:MAG: tol-pal system protein YbgF [Cytophagales bacterium]|nr:tol-pal system protein YbgF [Bernardetiaceae bacterium]MDW8211011.1 tol-pal system protein YbgF [Cytophagales bacterium]